MTTLTRRKALTAIAAAPAAVALSAVPAQSGPSELAAMIRRYFAEVDVFNATHHETDEESNSHAEVTYEATLDAAMGVPARTREDALAAVDFLERENAIESWGPAEAMLRAVRGYLEGRVS